MKNLKRALSLVLSTAMLVGMMVVGTGATFADAAESEHKDAIEVMNLLGIMEGDGENFNPDNVVTRNEMAVVMCNLLDLKLNGDHPFTDVAAWADDFVGAIYTNGYTAGKSATLYGGADKITTAEAALMIMKTLGYFEFQGEFGDDWKVATVKRAAELKLFEDIDAGVNEYLTRGEVAQMVYNALNDVVVNAYEEGGMTVEGNGISVSQKPTYEYYRVYNSLEEKLFGDNLVKTPNQEDVYGRPATLYSYKGDEVLVAETPVVVYTAKFTKGELVDDLKAEGVVLAKENSIKNDENDTKYGATGVVIEIFASENAKGEVVADDYVIIKTKIGQITNIIKDKTSTDKDDRAFYIDGKAITFESEILDNFNEIYANIEKEDWVLYTEGKDADGKTVFASVSIPETIEGKVSKVADGKATVDGTVYNITAGTEIAASVDAQTLWLDTYGNIIKGEKVDTSSDVVYVVDTFKETDKWGKATWFVRVVDAEGEVVELKTGDAEFTGTYKLATYTTNSDGIATLANAYATKIAENTEIKTSSAKVSGYYFADDVVFVYVDGVNADLETSVAAGVQKLLVTAAKEARFALNEDNEIEIVYVTGAADKAAAESLIFALDNVADGEALDNKGNAVDTFKFWINGEKMNEIASGLGLGFFNYTIDAETGAYVAKAEKNTYVGAFSIAQDKYITIASLEDVVLADDAEVYDLTENEMTTLAEIAALADEGTMTLNMGVVYDTDAKKVTTVYVYEVEA